MGKMSKGFQGKLQGAHPINPGPMTPNDKQYHYPSGTGTKNPTPSKKDNSMSGKRPYHYPSGPGDTNPLRNKKLG